MTKTEQNKMIIEHIETILSNRGSDQIYTITIDVHGDIGAIIKVEVDSMYEEEECCNDCVECCDSDIEAVATYLKSRGYDCKIIDHRDSKGIN